MTAILQKWDVLRAWPPNVGHSKYAVCVCPNTPLFFYINSEPPPFRRAKAIAIQLEAWQATFLTKPCFLDTAELIQLPTATIAQALATPSDCLGPVSPTVRALVVGCVSANNVLTAAQKAIVLLGEVVP